MQLPWFRKLSDFSKLSLFVFFLLAVVLFTTVSFSLREQRITSSAWMTSQKAATRCDGTGVVITASFTNTEPDSRLAMDVSVKDVQTGLSVNMGSVGMKQTKTVDIHTNMQRLDSSSVIFFLTWTSGAAGRDQRGATYAPVTCVTPDPTINPTFTPIPTTRPTIIPRPTLIPTSTLEPTVRPTLTYMPKPTIKPITTYFSFNIFLHGIGRGGDSANPKATDGNPTPNHKVRKINIEVYDSKNHLILSKSGEVEFASPSGSFTGRLDMGNNLTNGSYLIKIKADKYLRRSIPGIVSVKAGKVNVLSQVAMVTGDINNDNVINILDYNILMGCYGDLSPAKYCDDDTSADLTDDGLVNQFDYNLFLRELINRGGE